MSFLLRKRAGPFDISDAYTLEELAEKRRNGTLQSTLQSVDKVFGNMPCYTLDENSGRKFGNGMNIPVPGASFPDNAGNGNCLVRVYGSEGGFVAIGEIKANDAGMFLKVKKFF